MQHPSEFCHMAASCLAAAGSRSLRREHEPIIHPAWQRELQRGENKKAECLALDPCPASTQPDECGGAVQCSLVQPTRQVIAQGKDLGASSTSLSSREFQRQGPVAESLPSSGQGCRSLGHRPPRKRGSRRPASTPSPVCQNFEVVSSLGGQVPRHDGSCRHQESVASYSGLKAGRLSGTGVPGGVRDRRSKALLLRDPPPLRVDEPAPPLVTPLAPKVWPTAESRNGGPRHLGECLANGPRPSRLRPAPGLRPVLPRRGHANATERGSQAPRPATERGSAPLVSNFLPQEIINHSEESRDGCVQDNWEHSPRLTLVGRHMSACAPPKSQRAIAVGPNERSMGVNHAQRKRRRKRWRWPSASTQARWRLAGWHGWSGRHSDVGERPLGHGKELVEVREPARYIQALSELTPSQMQSTSLAPESIVKSIRQFLKAV